MDSNDQSQERVLIEDYRGPASTLPPSAPTYAQITAETKQEPGAVSQTDPTSSAIDWPRDLATLGRVLGACATGGLMPSTFVSLFYQNPDSHTALYYTIVSWPGVLIIGIAMLGFILCTIAIFRYRISRQPVAVLFKGRVGLILSSLALIVVVAGYLLG